MLSVRMVAFACVISVVSVMAADAGERRATLELEGRWWMPSFEGEARVTEAGIGTKVDLVDTLDLSDESFFMGRVTWYIGNTNHRIRASYIPISYSGDTRIDQRFEFDGRTFSIGDRVVTELDMQYGTLGWAWPITIAQSVFSLGPQIDIKIMDVEASIAGNNQQASGDFLAAFPTVGVIAELNPTERLSVFADISALYVGGYGHFYDAEAGLKLIPHRNFSLSAGYKVIQLKFEDDLDMVDLRIAGPFLGASLRF
ncbi:MAG TPA: hypothetical protein VM141_05390 [Planctomycetota bacterium]|nr:hypothetical protein [Planctomycetota bacterium]